MLPETISQDIKSYNHIEVEIEGGREVFLVIAATVRHLVRRGQHLNIRRKFPIDDLPALQDLAALSPDQEGCTPDGMRAAKALLEVAKGEPYGRAGAVIGRSADWVSRAYERLLVHGPESLRTYKTYRKGKGRLADP